MSSLVARIPRLKQKTSRQLLLNGNRPLLRIAVGSYRLLIIDTLAFECAWSKLRAQRLNRRRGESILQLEGRKLSGPAGRDIAGRKAVKPRRVFGEVKVSKSQWVVNAIPAADGRLTRAENIESESGARRKIAVVRVVRRLTEGDTRILHLPEHA